MSKKMKVITFLAISIVLISGTILYLAPDESIDEISDLDYSSQQIITYMKNNPGKDLKGAKIFLPSNGYFNYKKKSPDLSPQEFGNGSLNFDVNEKTRTLYIYSNGYDEKFCNELVSFADPSSLRNSFIGKMTQINKFEMMKEFKSAVNGRIKINGKELLNEDIKCEENNDLVYITPY